MWDALMRPPDLESRSILFTSTNKKVGKEKRGIDKIERSGRIKFCPLKGKNSKSDL